MKKYQTLKTITFLTGILELSPEQAAKRQHRLKKKGVRGSKYEVIDEVQFKAGEIIGIEKVNKLYEPHLREIAKEDED